MNISPSLHELLKRIELADDAACDGGWPYSDDDRGCRFCRLVVKYLRGGSVFCSDCGHINAIGHSCYGICRTCMAPLYDKQMLQLRATIAAREAAES